MSDTHPPDCLCAACLAATVAAPLPWEAAYDPTDALHAQINAALRAHGLLARVSSLGPRSWQALCVDAAGAHADDWPTSLGSRALVALEALAEALDRCASAPAPERLHRAPIVRSLADAFPRGVTLDAEQVDALVNELAPTLRRAGGAR